MFKKIRLWLAGKLVAGTEGAGPRLTVEQAERKTWITLNLSENGPLLGGDESEKRLIHTLRKAYKNWAAIEADVSARGLHAPSNYLGDDYPREGCTLTITGRENGRFGVLILTPTGDIIESWPCDTPEQLGLRVARWAGGKNPVRPAPGAALIQHVSDFVNLAELEVDHLGRGAGALLAGLDANEAQVATAERHQGVIRQV